ncbi:HEAT repeat domain-containing protein [bacterium]|nr:HEAT repeat domain-containing protein [bacterium]RQV97217.1 MAG: GWxTD domain-containing protein [bacterium]
MFRYIYHCIWRHRRLTSIAILFGWIVLNQNTIWADDGDALFKKAKKKTVAQSWDEAIAFYEEFIHEYQGHNNEDDAFFWLAYCLEKKMPNDIQAFLAYDELIQAFPKSTWTDDAVVHQIGMAARFVESGKEEFRDFLHEKLKDTHWQIRQQAAIALGKIRDKNALPILRKMAENPDYYDLVSPLIQNLEGREADDVPAIAAKSLKRSAFEVTTSAKGLEEAAEKEEKTWDWSGVLPTFLTKRHRQYQSMLKTEGKWTLNELIDFGMWTILPTNEFEIYRRLSGYDRSEWLRKYWKVLDPTPATQINEAFDEFKRRVNYAYTHFSETWDYRHLTYKRDMYQRLGWPNAPWDARGEIYIKYGPPQFQTIHGWHTEEWSYYKYHVDFIVKLYETNIYHEAIQPGSLSYYSYKDNIDYVISNYISTPEFRYHHEYNADPLKLKENRFFTEEGFLKFDYSIPIKELGYEKSGDVYQFGYDLTVVVFDEDMREVIRQEKEKMFQRENRRAYKKDQYYLDQIRLQLVPGPYLVSIQIDDKYSKKLGIYMKNLDTSRPPE